MAAGTGPVLARIHPVTLGRLFRLRFGSRRRAPSDPNVGRYREEVASEVARRFGVSLPRGLDWLIAAAQRRAIPANDLVAFLGWAFDLEPMTGR